MDRFSKETKEQSRWFDPEQQRVMREYVFCLVGRARVLAVVSDEPAETIIQAAVSACDDKADQLRETYRKRGDALGRINATAGLDGDETRREYADMAENLLEHLKTMGHNDLILAVIEERARRRNEQD